MLLSLPWADPRLGLDKAKEAVKRCIYDYGFYGVKLNGAQNSFYIDHPDISLPVVEEIFGDGGVLFRDVADIDKLAEFRLRVGQMRSPTILSTFSMDDPGYLDRTKGLRIMGQRWIPDSYMFQNLVHDKVPHRYFPTALEVPAVLGCQRARELVAAGRPVFVNFTAAWCISCQVNEKVLFSTDEVKDLFRSHGVTALKADWTNKDERIARALADHGRDGVPLYVYYSGVAGQPPRILPQIPTRQSLIDTFAGRRITDDSTR